MRLLYQLYWISKPNVAFFSYPRKWKFITTVKILKEKKNLSMVRFEKKFICLVYQTAEWFTKGIFLRQNLNIVCINIISVRIIWIIFNFIMINLLFWCKSNNTSTLNIHPQKVETDKFNIYIFSYFFFLSYIHQFYRNIFLYIFFFFSF